MFYSLTGKLIHTDANTAVVECGGVGFKCFVTGNTLSRLPRTGQPVTLFTHLNVREDALDLFGFYELAELEAYKMIVSVNGVGPKVALSILSEFEPERLALCVATGDHKTLQRANGVGAKLAQRIVLELKDKLGISGGSTSEGVRAAGTVSASSNAATAIEALVVLGYSQSEAALAVGKLDAGLPVETLIKEELKHVGN